MEKERARTYTNTVLSILLVDTTFQLLLYIIDSLNLLNLASKRTTCDDRSKIQHAAATGSIGY